MTELPKVMGFAELKGEGRYHGAYDRAEVAPTWRDRLAKWFWPEGLRALFDVQAENRRLRVKLLEAVRACEDAGRIGLQLYDENELLREKIGKTPEQHIARMAAFDELRREKAKVEDKLKRAYEDHQRLHDQVNEWIAQFGEPK
jgi:hypothetical protein